MNWYVKYNETGEISGPVDQKTALSMAEQFDGVAFSEQIFCSRRASTSEVDLLIERLTAWKLNDVSSSLRKLVGDAIDTITLLCREKAPVTSQEVKELLYDLRGMAGDVVLYTKADRHTFQQVMDALVKLSREKAPVTSQEVEQLLHELKGLRTSMEIVRNGEDDAIGLLCGRISGALVPQVSAIPKDLEVIIRVLRLFGSRETDCHECGGFDEEDCNVCKDAADALVQLSREKKVTATPSGDFKEIIRELRALEVDVVLRGPDRQTCKAAADALSQLRLPEATSPAVKGCLTFLRKEKQEADTTDCCGDHYLYASMQRVSKICQRAIDTITSMAIVRNPEDDTVDALVKLSREKIITGVLTGGMLTLDDLPEGVSVDIRNYDAHGTEENLKTDDSGYSYSNLHWGA